MASASPFARDQRRQPQHHPFETTRPLATDVPFSSHRQSGNKETPHELKCPQKWRKKKERIKTAQKGGSATRFAKRPWCGLHDSNLGAVAQEPRDHPDVD